MQNHHTVLQQAYTQVMLIVCALDTAHGLVVGCVH